MPPAEVIGYIASLLVIISLTMSSVLRLRLVSLVGAIAWFIYGVMLNAPPIFLTNGIIIVINTYFLAHMLTTKHYFRLLEVSPDSSYIQSFLDFYRKDIVRFFPNFEYKPAKADMLFLILRDMIPVGLFVTERDSANRVLVDIDYVIPGYRDLAPGRFLYEQIAQRLPQKGIHTLYSVPGNEKHQKYLRRMGFSPTAETTSGSLFQKTLH
jgi:hypothetical protein